MSRKLLFVFVFLLVVYPLAGQGHQVNLFCHRVDETIEGEVYFGDGAPCRECSGKVVDGGEKLVEFATDRQGKFQFALPEVDDFTVQVRTGGGHGVEKEVRLNSVPAPGNKDSAGEPAPKYKQRLGQKVARLRTEVFRAKIAGGLGIILGLTALAWLFLRPVSEPPEK